MGAIAQSSEKGTPEADLQTIDIRESTEPPVVLVEARRGAKHFLRFSSSTRVLLAVDVLCLAGPALWDPAHLKALLALAGLTTLFLWAGSLYRPQLQALFLDELPSLAGRGLAATGVIATTTALRHNGHAVGGFLDVSAQALGLFLAGRIFTNFGIREARRRHWSSHPTLLVGSGRLTERLAATLAGAPKYGLRVVGYVADQPNVISNMTFYGRVSQVQEAIRAFGASVVLISDHGFPEDDLMVVVRDALKLGCDIFMVPRLHQMTRQPSFREMIGAVPVVRLDHDPCRRLTWRAKRILDVIAAAAALILLSPLFLVIAIAVHIDNGAGILFRQTRLGRNAKPFELLKFRSMRPVSEGESATKWSISGDKRVTAVGRILRRTSLDELPQLWNVLRGDMTIVGPRPERPFFVDKFAAEDPEYTMRHRVRVGLTGLAQVNGLRGDTSISERSRFDNYYIENWSLWLDIKVILRTVFEVVGGRGR